MSEFSRTLAAQGAAKCIVDCAAELGWLNTPVAVSPRLAEAEKDLIIKMITELRRRFGENNGELQSDEVSSLFTFVFAKAAEAVTNMYNRQPDNFELTGMLDGKIPIYADDRITGEFKKSMFPVNCASGYLAWSSENSALLAGNDPVLLLFESLKWCFRLSCHAAITIVDGPQDFDDSTEEDFDQEAL